MKIALVYDRVNKWGGAERVLLALHEIFPEAPLFTSVYDDKKAPWAKVFNVKTSFIQNIPFVKNHHELFPFLMPFAFESMQFDNYDLIISVTSEAAKGIITKPHVKHLCICLTPTRYLWSGYNEYFKNLFLNLTTKPIVGYLRNWDLIAAKRPDKYIAISEEVKRRIKNYYKEDSTIVYPYSQLAEKLINLKPKNGEYFLVVSRNSRFTSYKYIDLAVRTAGKLQIPLVVVGSRSNFGNSYKTVKFAGNISDSDLLNYYLSCKALIFCGVEDFGLTMVEAQAAGKPVIAYRGGGALEIVREGKTGEFFDEQTMFSLARSLQSFDGTKYNVMVCRENARRFSKSNFEKSLSEIVKNL